MNADRQDLLDKVKVMDQSVSLLTRLIPTRDGANRRNLEYRLKHKKEIRDLLKAKAEGRI